MIEIQSEWNGMRAQQRTNHNWTYKRNVSRKHPLYVRKPVQWLVESTRRIATTADPLDAYLKQSKSILPMYELNSPREQAFKSNHQRIELPTFVSLNIYK